MQSAPRIAYLLVTGRCNLDCAGCYATLEHWGRHTKRGELSLRQYEGIVAELVALGVRIFDISGGEPMLRPDLAEICGLIRAHEGTRIWLVSNGTLAPPETLARLAPLVERLAISLDAPDAALHDRLRGKEGAFARSIAALRGAARAGFAERAVNFLLCRENHRSLGAMLDLCGREGIERLAVLSYRDVSENGVDPQAIPTLDALRAAWADLADRLAGLARPLHVDLVVPAFLRPEAHAFWSALPRALRARITVLHPHLRGQSAFRDTIVIKPFGRITGDTAMVNTDLFEIGSALDDVGAIWADESLAWRRRLAAREEHLRACAPCRDCARWNACRGGCPAAAVHQWGDLLRHDRSCDQFRAAGVF